MGKRTSNGKKSNFLPQIPPPPPPKPLAVKTKKRIILSLCLVLNLAILFFFKYHNFFADTVTRFFAAAGLSLAIPRFHFLLPVGISFYTFQAIGYSIDVYRGDVRAEKNFLTYALFVTFFPQLVAGPIERTKNLLPQFKTDHQFDYQRVTDGMKLAAWGMFKKIAVADTLAVYVNAAYDDLSGASGTALVIAAVLFAFQIYCDFSGYTDTAIGVAHILGFKLMKNFDKPYLASSISEFWKRWHISLSTWFKDYVYIPLGGNRVCLPRHYVNLLVTFLVSGLWHGAAMHFVAWGLLHGVYLVIEHSIKTAKERFLPSASAVQANTLSGKAVHAVQIFITFFFVCIAWVFFRADSIGDAFTVLKKMTAAPVEISALGLGLIRRTLSFGEGIFMPYTVGLSKLRLARIIILVILLSLTEITTRKQNGIAIINTLSPARRWTLYYAFMLIFIVAAIMGNGSKEFIYFQF